MRNKYIFGLCNMIFSIGSNVLDACVLAILMKGDSYGYKLTQDVQEQTVISDSTLYPVLKRLLKAELVTSYNVEYDGRNRKYYKITKKGKKQHSLNVAEWKSFRKKLDNIFK